MITESPLLAPLRPFRRRHFALLREVASIQHRLLDQSTGLGYVWSFLQPVLLLLVLYGFFSQRVGADIPNYALFLLVGLVQYTHFSKTTGSGMRVLQRMRTLATNVIFPKDLLVYSALLADLPEFLISLGITTVIALMTGSGASWALLLLPVVVLAQFLLVLWVSLLLATLHAFVRDLEHLFEVAMRMLFFVSPLLYSVDSLSPSMRSLAMLNPLAQVIVYTRDILIDGKAPPIGGLLLFLAMNLALAYVALVIFRRAEPALVERL
jgi:ABC-type polysaccharide/polyol phosphate export permease